jgi:hypothetical protein
MLTPSGQSVGWRPAAGSNKRAIKRNLCSRPVHYVVIPGLPEGRLAGYVCLWIVVTRREECGSEMRPQLCMAGDSRAKGYSFTVGKQRAHGMGEAAEAGLHLGHVARLSLLPIVAVCNITKQPPALQRRTEVARTCTCVSQRGDAPHRLELGLGLGGAGGCGGIG